jgi:hypothetical protein
LSKAIIKDVGVRGEGIGITVAEWSNAVLNNGLGHYQKALSAAQRAIENYDGELVFPNWGLIELIEAAVRSGSPERATEAMRRLSQSTGVSGSDWALGVRTRSRALLSEGKRADRLYREAIERLTRTRMRAELARAHLVYGEWLRREKRRTDAREQLRVSYQMLTAMGMEGFAERARVDSRGRGRYGGRRLGGILVPAGVLAAMCGGMRDICCAQDESFWVPANRGCMTVQSACRGVGCCVSCSL